MKKNGVIDMSKQETTKINCPKCDKEHDFTIWSSINVTLDPDKKEAVLNRKAFTFECPDCKEKTLYTYDFLYHDMEQKVMIYHVTTNEALVQAMEGFAQMKNIEGGDGILNGPEVEGYKKRIVRSLNELREKIFIFDAGLDDRVVEIFKVFCIIQLKQNDPNFQADEAYFFSRDGEIGFQFLREGKAFGEVEIDPADYEDIAKTAAGILAKDDQENCYVIDTNWAYKNMSEED